MRTGKPGIWWVLQQKDMPLFFTGELAEFRVNGDLLKVPVFAEETEKAQQSADEAGAVMLASIFGISDRVKAVQFEFVA